MLSAAHVDAAQPRVGGARPHTPPRMRQPMELRLGWRPNTALLERHERSNLTGLGIVFNWQAAHLRDVPLIARIRPSARMCTPREQVCMQCFIMLCVLVLARVGVLVEG